MSRWHLVATVVALAAAGVVTAAVVQSHKPRGTPRAAPFTPTRVPDRVTVTGHVIDRDSQGNVGGVSVYLLGPHGELQTMSSGDGSYSIVVPPATYRVFVRDDRVLSVGSPDRVRIDPGPRGELVGVGVAGLMPTLDATTDVRDADVSVVRTARLIGRVIDISGQPVPGALVRAIGTERPVLGTDLTRADPSGNFELRVPEGRYSVEAALDKYPASTARLIVISSAAPMRTTLELDPGCIVTGTVVGPNGAAVTGGGAIERDIQEVARFGPATVIGNDGRFRFTTRENNDVTIRAWPWGMPPSQEKTFPCHPGGRYDGVKLAVPKREPGLAGTIVDAAGDPVGFANLDIKPLDRTSESQLEQADALGVWRVFELQPGRYEVTATVPGRGIVVADLTAPSRDGKLVLGGTGRIAGTVTGIVDGVIEVVFEACSDAFDARNKPMIVAHEPRLVVVRGGRFVIDGVPACHLTFATRWHWATTETSIDVVARRATIVELDLGVPHQRHVHGTVHDAAGDPVASAHVTEKLGERVLGSATTDANGRFELSAVPGAELGARAGARTGTALIGRATIDDEAVDIVVADQ